MSERQRGKGIKENPLYQVALRCKNIMSSYAKRDVLLWAVPRKVVYGDGEGGVSAEVESAQGGRRARQAPRQEGRPHGGRHLAHREVPKKGKRRKKKNKIIPNVQRKKMEAREHLAPLQSDGAEGA